jgi:hypothetical protein
VLPVSVSCLGFDLAASTIFLRCSILLAWSCDSSICLRQVLIVGVFVLGFSFRVTRFASALVGEQGISHKFTDGHILCFVVMVWAASHVHKSSHRGQLVVPIFNLIPPLSSCTGLAQFLFLLVSAGAGALLGQTFTGCWATSFDLVFTGVAFPLVLVADSSSVPA